MSTKTFEGKHVVVAGCGIGITGFDDISHATAVRLAAEGAHVSFVQVTQEAADKAVEEIRVAGGTADAYVHDPRDPAAIEALANQITEPRPTVDSLVTHYFAANFSSISKLSLEDWEETVRVNLTGAFAATKAFLPALRAAERATIVHAGSVDGNLGNVNVPSYSASKGGVHVLIHVLAGELAAEGIRVNGIARASSSAMPLPDNVFEQLSHATPLVRPADPAEYASAIAFLAGPEAAYITGAVLPVDGGRTALTPGCTPSYAGFAQAAQRH